MVLTIEGGVEVDASLFNPGVLEDAFRTYLGGRAPVTYGRDQSAVLGRVTKIGGRGKEVVITAELPGPPPRTVLKDAWNKIRSGSIKALGIEGGFSPDSAVVSSVYVLPVSAVPGTGYLTNVVAS